MIRAMHAVVALAVLLAMVAGCSRGGPAADRHVARASTSTTHPQPVAIDNVTFDARFSTIDNDDDGQIDFGEYAASATGRFVTMDLDGNGLVTPAEMDAHRAALGRHSRLSSAQVIQPVDSDGDGMLAQWENETIARRLFDTIDRNHDGVLTKEEARARAALLDANE
jgi:Ca2+-binding EF-hand superfamily protein